MKKIIQDAIDNILNHRKLFYINLHQGNEKCIQGDLYSELRNTQKLNVALEYPIGNREHADIAIFSNDDFETLQSVIELKHYSPHQKKPEISAEKEIKKEIIKRFKNNINEVYVIQILTHIEFVDNVNVLNKYPFTKSYVKNQSKIDHVAENDIINIVNNRLLNSIDNTTIHVTNNLQINNEINVRLHFFICGPFFRGELFFNRQLLKDNLPINRALQNN